MGFSRRISGLVLVSFTDLVWKLMSSLGFAAVPGVISSIFSVNSVIVSFGCSFYLISRTSIIFSLSSTMTATKSVSRPSCFILASIISTWSSGNWSNFTCYKRSSFLRLKSFESLNSSIWFTKGVVGYKMGFYCCGVDVENVFFLLCFIVMMIMSTTITIVTTILADIIIIGVELSVHFCSTKSHESTLPLHI